jgi:hypothetical protein
MPSPPYKQVCGDPKFSAKGKPVCRRFDQFLIQVLWANGFKMVGAHKEIPNFLELTSDNKFMMICLH